MIELIAEVGSVHDGSFGNALKLIDAAADSGASTVKFQTHIAEAETTPDAPQPPYFKAEPRFEYFQRTGFTLDQWKKLKRRCEENDVGFLSSPFSNEAVDLLEEVGIERYKIASGEVTNLPLLEYVAETKKPVLLSSGMSSWAELDEAVKVLSKGGELTIMQCTSSYPTPYDQVGLNIIGEMKQRYNVSVGYSDHTLGNTAAIAAATVGAEIIEKHFTFSKLMYGSDAANSSEPKEFAELARALKAVDSMLSNPVNKNDIEDFREMKEIFQKSLVSRRNLPKGKKIQKEDLSFKKPGTGIPAGRWESIVGKRLKKEVNKNYMFKEEDFE